MYKVFIVLFSFVVSTSAGGQVNWALAKEKDDIKVFTSTGSALKFKAIKVEAKLSGSIDKLVYLLTNATSNKDWIFNTKDSYLIRRTSNTETLSYTETSLPWPASNRDLALKMNIYNEPKTRSLKVTAVGMPNVIPLKKGIVRIPYFNSHWNVQADGKGKLNIVYDLEMDPGGSVPAWINNLFVAKGPYETFSKLAVLLKQQ